MVIGGDHLDFLGVAGAAGLCCIIGMRGGGNDGLVFVGVAGRSIGGQMAGETVETVRKIQFDVMAAQTLEALFIEAGGSIIALIAAACRKADKQQKETGQKLNQI